MMVLVCNDPKFIFLKTKKTAGTSVEILFQPFCLPDNHDGIVANDAPVVSERGVVGARGSVKHGAVEWWHHMTAGDIATRIGQDAFDASFKFATVRNPYRTTLSRYFFARRQPYPTTYLGFLNQRRKFRQWLRDRSSDHGKFGNSNIVHLNGTFVLDDYIRQERLAQDINRIAAQLRCDVDVSALQNSKRNPGAERFPPSAYFSERCAEMVQAAYAWCFDHCGYSRDVRVA